MRDLDAEYDELMDELEAAVRGTDTVERGQRIQAVRVRIEDVLRQQLGFGARLPSNDRQHKSSVLH